MRRSVSNPRIVLPAVGAAVLLWSVVGAYVERPRVELGLGGVGGSIAIEQEEFPDSVVRSAPFREALEEQLTSPQFLARLAAENPRWPPHFWEQTRVVIHHAPRASLDVNPMVAALTTVLSETFNGQTIGVVLGESGQADLYVMYFFPQGYGVRKPTNSWILWFQAWLPGISRSEELAAEANAANERMESSIKQRVLQSAWECAELSRTQ